MMSFQSKDSQTILFIHSSQALSGSAIDRHLLGLKMIAKENGLPVPPFLTDALLQETGHWRMATSQVKPSVQLQVKLMCKEYKLLLWPYMTTEKIHTNGPTLYSYQNTWTAQGELPFAVLDKLSLKWRNGDVNRRQFHIVGQRITCCQLRKRYSYRSSYQVAPCPSLLLSRMATVSSTRLAQMTSPLTSRPGDPGQIMTPGHWAKAFARLSWKDATCFSRTRFPTVNCDCTIDYARDT